MLPLLRNVQPHQTVCVTDRHGKLAFFYICFPFFVCVSVSLSVCGFWACGVYLPHFLNLLSIWKNKCVKLSFSGILMIQQVFKQPGKTKAQQLMINQKWLINMYLS